MGALPFEKTAGKAINAKIQMGRLAQQLTQVISLMRAGCCQG